MLYEAPIKRPISLKILLDFRDMMTVTLERRGFEVADVQSMKLPNVNNCRPYEQPVLRKRTSEQAHTFLVGHAFIGDKGAKERKKQFSSQNLRGHIKSGQRWSLQNRPTKVAWD